MEKNVGGYDRFARFIIGPALLIIGGAAGLEYIALATGTLGFALWVGALLVGAILTTTALIQKCPLNALFGINTFRERRTTETATDDQPVESRPS